MHAKVSNGQIAAYPYTVGMLRADNPNTLFPAAYNLDDAAEYGVVRVEMTSRPELDATKHVTEGPPQLIGDAWMQTWIVTDATADEIAARTEAQAQEMREQRNQILSTCDWTQLPDAPVGQAAWATYRQALRDLPSDPGWPWDFGWPQPPA